MQLSPEEIDQLETNQLTREDIMLLRMRNSTSVADIAILLGLSRQWVSKQLKDIYAKIEAQRTADHDV